MTLTVPGIYTAKGEGYFSVPDSKQNTTLLVVDLPQGVYAGKSVSVKF
jgi:chondroitin AC lyase